MCGSASEAFQERRRESRLADARFAREQHYMTFAALRLRPAPQQQLKLFFSSDKLGHAARVKSLKAALDRSRSQCSPGSHRPSDALEVLCPKVLHVKQNTTYEHP